MIESAASPMDPPARLPRPATPGCWKTIPAGVLLAVVLGYIMLLPPQFNAAIGGAALPPYRFYLLGSILYILGSLSKGRWRMFLPDYMMLLAGVWIWISFWLNNSNLSDFFTASVAQSCDIVVAYFFARAAFSSLRDLRLFLLLMVPGFAVTSGVVILESVTKTHLVQPLARSLLGTGGGYSFYDYRMGLLRAPGPFPHPILAGIFLASLLPLYFFSGLRSWPRWVGVGAAFGSFFALSSAALLALTLGIALAAYTRLSEMITNLTWRLLFVLMGLFIFVAELGTKSGTFNLIVRFGSLNSDSAYYRTLIWTFGSKNVAEHPWFGIGYGDWKRPFWMGSSVDHYWLLQAIQFGIIPPLMYALVVFLGVVGLGRLSMKVNLVDQRTLRGLAITLTVFAFGVVSVSVWLSAQVWFHMLMGLSISLGYAALKSFRPRMVVFRPRVEPLPAPAGSPISRSA